MKKLLIFDLDGTLLNTLLDLTDGVNYALQAFSYPNKTPEEVMANVGNGIGQLVLKCLPNDSHFNEALDLFKTYYLNHCTVKTYPYENMSLVLNTLKKKGYVLTVISNKAMDLSRKIIAYYFPHIFDYVIGESPDFPKKPDSTSLYYLLSHYNVSLEEILYIGDSEVDISYAKNNKIDNLIVSYGFRSKEYLLQLGAEGVVEKPFDLLARIK